MRAPTLVGLALVAGRAAACGIVEATLSTNASAPLYSRAGVSWQVGGFGMRQLGVPPAGRAAALVVPKSAELCEAKNSAAWAGRYILANDWTQPGCSMEQRARAANGAGAAGVLFKGHEGNVFDYDGTDVSGVGLDVAVLSWAAYSRLAALGARHGDANVTVRVEACMSPLLTQPFAAIQWVQHHPALAPMWQLPDVQRNS